MDNYIPLSDLGVNGIFSKSLEQFSLPVIAPNPNKVAIHGGPPHIFYDSKNGGNIPTSDEPFIKGITYGYTKAQVQYSDGTWHDAIFAVTPVLISVPNNPDQANWVILYQEKPQYGTSDTQFINQLKDWQKGRQLMIGGFTNSDPASNLNTIETQMFSDFPDIQSRIKQFQQTLDPSFISTSGINLMTFDAN